MTNIEQLSNTILAIPQMIEDRNNRILGLVEDLMDLMREQKKLMKQLKEENQSLQSRVEILEDRSDPHDAGEEWKRG